jgi:hypothetical protein
MLAIAAHSEDAIILDVNLDSTKSMTKPAKAFVRRHSCKRLRCSAAHDAPMLCAKDQPLFQEFS